MTLLDRVRAAAARHQRIDPSWHYRLPEQFRDVRPAEEVTAPLSSSIGGADLFVASIYNGHHGTALRRIR